MPVAYKDSDFLVTDAKIAALVERIVAAADPLEIIVFGSRARGDHHLESDLDLAVIVEDDSLLIRDLIYKAAKGRTMAVDLLILGKARFVEFRPWINTVERQIDREGVRYYTRDGQSAHSQAA